MNLKCKLFGHQITYDERGYSKTDALGYLTCERCGSHEGSDSEEWEILSHGILRPFQWRRYLWFNHFWLFECWDWGADNARNCHERAPWNRAKYDDDLF